MFRKVLGGLSAAALVFGSLASVNAQNLCDVDCPGFTYCEITIDGVTVAMNGFNYMDGSKAKNVSDTEKVVTIQCKELNVSDRDRENTGQATIDEDKESTITITSESDSGTPFFPASARVVSYVKLEMNDKSYTSESPLVLRTVDTIKKWPSTTALTYELAKDVTFVSEGNDSKVVFSAGSTATMRASD